MPTLASIIDRYTNWPRPPYGGRWHRWLVSFHREKTRTRERARKESGAQGFSRTARLSKLLTSTWFRLTRALEALISMHINHKTANGITGARRFPPTARGALLGARGQALQPIDEQDGAKGNAYQYLAEWQGMKPAEALALLEKAGAEGEGAEDRRAVEGRKILLLQKRRGARDWTSLRQAAG